MRPVGHREAWAQGQAQLLRCLLAGCIAFLSLLPFAGRAAAAPAQDEDYSPRLLTAAAGRALVQAAWEHQQQLTGKPDCSHLVNEIYRLAGFPYAYASSFDLFAGGSDQFARVKTAQPGDLIVWPGHVGLVVDPALHSFYSSVTEGLDTQDYDSKYWRQYGSSRFYRYRITDPEKFPAAAETRPNAAINVPEKVQIVTVPVIEDDDEDAPAPAPPARAAMRSASAPLPVKNLPVSPARSATIPSSATRATKTEASAPEAPKSILLVSRGKKPSAQQVGEAITEMSNSARAALRPEDLLQPRLPVVVFDQLRVENVHVKGDRGWADVQVTSRASLSGEKREAKRRQEKHRWELRRGSSGWSALAPLDRIYVPRDAAVRVLAGQLSKLAAGEKDSPQSAALLRQEAQLAGFLNDLLKN
jgi:hypothetical protein